MRPTPLSPPCPLQRRRKNRSKVEPQVKVESAAVDMVTGKTPASAVGEAETRVVQVLGFFFFVLLTEGLVLAGSVSRGRGGGSQGGDGVWLGGAGGRRVFVRATTPVLHGLCVLCRRVGCR